MSRVIAYHTFFGGPVRNINPELVARGWEWYSAERMPLFAKAGYTRHIIGNPLGWDHGEEMEADQFVEGAEVEAVKLLADPKRYSDAFRPWVNRGHELWTYYGKLDGDREIEDRRRPEKLDDLLEYMARCLKPAADAGMGIFLDAAVAEPYFSVAHGLAILARACGVKVGVEANPAKDKPHWAFYLEEWGGLRFRSTGYAILALSNWWDGHGTKDGWNIELEHLKGELIYLVNDPPPGVDADFAQSRWVEGYVEELLNRPYKPSVAVVQWRLEQLMRRGIGREKLEGAAKRE